MSKAHIVGIGVCVYVRAGVRVREVGTPRIIHIILYTPGYTGVGTGVCVCVPVLV